jgi:23S rRNA (cytosine1962-C5)-methyltransferase
MQRPSAVTRAPSRLRLRVSAAAETRLRGGHPWLFADSIREQNRPGSSGELAVIYDRRDRFLAVGLFDPASPIRVRVLHAGQALQIDATWWSRALDAALERRQNIADRLTTGLRWIHGESDHFPGLVLDRYDDTLVLKLYSAVWMPRLNEIIALIEQRLQPARLVLRLSRNLQSAAQSQFNLSDGTVLRGAIPDGAVHFSESGLRFEADVLRGQKTGFFLDQRENRRRVEALAGGRSVLNAFSFSGGFSLYAARGGAKAVTDLDVSSHALEAGSRNFDLNHSEPSVARCPRRALQADAFEWLAGSQRARFDLIILDPPSLAKREAERAGAIKAYGRLAAAAIRRLNSGGILVACSCSAHVSAAEFFDVIRRMASGSRAEEMTTTGHPADHPATFPEANYLKAIYLRF